MTTVKSNGKSNGYKVVGTRPIRHDGWDKVTGRAQYGADVNLPGMIYGKILRSPHAHARIVSIDTSRAEAFEGVKAVVTAKDFPNTGVNPDEVISMGESNVAMKYLRENVLASKKVIYKGQAIAGVAAENVHIAQEALDLIDVEYDVLPPVVTVLDAMKEDAPLLHDDMHTSEVLKLDLDTEDLGKESESGSNIAEHFQHKLGDIDKGFDEADVVVEREFHTATVHQGYIEPHNATAYWNKDGRVMIWRSTQGPFEIRGENAKLLGLEESDVQVNLMEIGGGFGGKFSAYGDPVAALLSKKTGVPVKIVMTRIEEFESTGPTPGSYIKVKIGATKDGNITTGQAYLAYEAGAFPGSPVGPGAMCVFGAYDITNVLIDGYDVVLNKPKTAAYRAPGATNAAFAAETVIDEIAEKLGLDSLEIRLKNAAKEGTRRADGVVFSNIGCEEVIQAMKNHPHWKSKLEGPNRGRGVGLGYWFNVGGPASVSIMVNSNGTVNLTEGSADIGGTRASIAMQAAEVLGIRAEDVNPAVVGTDSIGFTSGTGGSSVTFKTGWAAYAAAHDVLNQMVERAAKIWNVDADTLEMKDGVVSSKTDSKLTMTFKEVASQAEDTGGPIVGRGNTNSKTHGAGFAGAIADVEVDPETGKVDILRFTMAQDVGTAIHPSYVEGQIQGGSAQGIGWALNEEYFMSKDGAMMNTSWLDYRMPTSLDLPMLDAEIVEVPNLGHPFGVRGVGEVNIVPPPAAIANAIYNAVGVRMNKLPMNPGAVQAEIQKNSNNGSG